MDYILHVSLYILYMYHTKDRYTTLMLPYDHKQVLCNRAMTQRFKQTQIALSPSKIMPSLSYMTLEFKIINIEKKNRPPKALNSKKVQQIWLKPKV